MKAMHIAALILLIALPNMAAAATSSLSFDALELNREGRLSDLVTDRATNTITLDNSRLYEDDAPATGVPEGYDYRGVEWKEDLVRGVVAKKILVIDDPRAISGRLLIKMIEVKDNMTTLTISVNGVEFERPASAVATPMAKQYTVADWDRWFYIDLPVGALRAGENEIRLSSDSETAQWRVLIALEEEFKRGSLTRIHHPNRSMKSSDGGRSFSDSKLGTTDAVDGEYSIRISLDQYVPSGEYVSPVIDVTGCDSPLKKLIRVDKIGCRFDIDIPEGGSAATYVRFDDSPLTDSPGWSDWQKVDNGAQSDFSGTGRYLQWKTTLSTANPLVSPRIKGLQIESEWEDISPNSGLGLAVHVDRNGHVVRSSCPFGYEDLMHPGLATFRETYKLDTVTDGAKTEFDLMMRLLNWAYRIPVTSNQYSWDWNDVPIAVADENGMPKLQEEYSGRRRDAMCLYSNQALVGALLAMGYQARHINIHSEGVSGHEVTEVWSNDFNKWFYMDATRDYYYFDPETGVPLNELEIHNRLLEHVPRVEDWRNPVALEYQNQLGKNVNIGIREGDNPVSIVEHGTHLIEIMGHFRIIPRNNFLSEPLPVPVHTGATMWGWDGFLNWYDEKFPKRWEYQLQTNRAQDFYEPLNQSEVFLSETDSRGVLKVEIGTFTPGGLDCFLVKLDNGRWLEMKEPAWDWPLSGGMNTLEVRTRNVRGVLGPLSRLRVTYNP